MGYGTMREQIADIMRQGTDQISAHPGVQAALSATLVAAGVTLDAIEDTAALVSLLIGCILGIITIYATLQKIRIARRHHKAWERDRKREKAARGDDE